jgi:predicted esterase
LTWEHRISYSRTARYFCSNEPSAYTPYLCYVLHGYGQLPQYFLKKFTRLARKDILFVAPEGLHRFYLKGNDGRVGSSWMTKEDRLQDIKDYCQLLDAVHVDLSWSQQRQRQKIAVLGFSQGVATAARWAAHSSHSFDELILWSGAFPPDLDFNKAADKLPHTPIHLRLGNDDPYASLARLEEQSAFLKKQGLQVEAQAFEGGHELPLGELKSLFSFLFPL